MLLFLGILAYAIVGTVIGRVLFLKRMGASARYTVGDSYETRNQLVITEDMSSAQTYGLWSPFVWPMTVAFYIIQAPTPAEKQARRIGELKDAAKALEAVAKEYDLKVTI